MQPNNQAPRMAAWLILLIMALIFGLPLNTATLFWVGILSAWVMTRSGD